MEIVIIAWLLVFAAAALLRIASALTPIRGSIDFTEILLPYALVALAPVAGYRSATAPFSCGPLPAQPGLRLARYGRWLVLGPLVTRAHHAFGPFGFMASLLIGHAAKRCVALRSFELLLAVPAMNSYAPEWSTKISDHGVPPGRDEFSLSDVFRDGVAFDSAVPPNAAFAWIMNIFMQLAIMTTVTNTGGLPSGVAIALNDFMRG